MRDVETRGSKRNNILVTYATRAGSTFEVAEQVAEVLRTTGDSMDVRPAPAVHEVKAMTLLSLAAPFA